MLDSTKQKTIGVLWRRITVKKKDIKTILYFFEKYFDTTNNENKALDFLLTIQTITRTIQKFQSMILQQEFS